MADKAKTTTTTPTTTSKDKDATKKTASTENNKILKATLQTCLGCQLKKSPHVKEFIDLDLPKFNNLTLEPKSMQPPMAIFHNKDGQVIESVSLVGKSREECNQLFFNKGFAKNESKSKYV